MTDSGYEDATIGMAEDILRHDLEGHERNGVEDRTAADVMRRNDVSEEAIELCFGYRPLTRMRRPLERRGERPSVDHGMDQLAAAFLAR